MMPSSAPCWNACSLATTSLERLDGLGLAVGVGDDRDLVLVDHGVERVGDVGVLAALGAVVADVRAGRHRVHRLDVERLLAEPAGRIALLGVGEVLRRGPASAGPAANAGVAVAGRVGVGVGLDRRRGVRVDDPDGHTRARVRRAALIGAAQLRRAGSRTASTGSVAPLNGRQRRLEVRLVLGRRRAVRRPSTAARSRTPAGGGNDCCSGFITLSVGRQARRRRARRPRSRPAPVGVAVGAWNVSSPLVKSCSVVANAASAAAAVARRRDVAARRLDAGRLQALGLQPLLDGLDRRVGRRVLGAELLRRQELPVRRAARRRDGRRPPALSASSPPLGAR